MAPFQPVGDRSRWRIIYEDVLVHASVGDLVTYEALADALDLDAVEDRHTIQVAMRRAAQEFEEQDHRALNAVPNRGYEVVRPSAHLVLARQHQSKAVRSLKRGHSKAVNVDLNGVDPNTRKALELVALAFAAQLEYNTRLDVRQDRLEQALQAQAERNRRTDEEVAQLQARLARLEEATAWPDPD